ncbi:MAG: hypothetical protein ACXVKL_18035, partial [Candidatus Angelobacter sp.]
MEYSSDSFHSFPFRLKSLLDPSIRYLKRLSWPEFFLAVTFSKALAFTLMYSSNRGEFVEGS